MDERPYPRVPHRLMWHTLGEFAVHATAGREGSAADQIAALVRDVGVSPEVLEQIKAATARALHAIEREDTRQSVANVRIHTLASAAQADEHAQRGWGFFLISNRGDGSQLEPTSAGQIIELFLYPEGDAREMP